MNRYDTLCQEEWYKALRRYPVIVDLERRRLGADLFDIDEFHRVLENGNFRGVCLNDVKFSDKILEPSFRDFLGRYRWKARFNKIWTTIGWLMALAIVGAAGWLVFTQSLPEVQPWTKEWVEKLTYKFDTGVTKNAYVPTAIVLGLAAIVAALVYGVWTYVTLSRFGFCKKCGNFVFGRHIFHVKCACLGRILFLS